MKAHLVTIVAVFYVAVGLISAEPNVANTEEFRKSAEQTRVLFPELLDETSPMAKQAVTFHRAFREARCAFYSSPNRPLLVAGLTSRFLQRKKDGLSESENSTKLWAEVDELNKAELAAQKPKPVAVNPAPAPSKVYVPVPVPAYVPPAPVRPAARPTHGPTTVLPIGGGNYITSDGKGYTVLPGGIVVPMNP